MAMMRDPCSNMVDDDKPWCALSRKVPWDCHHACAHYDPEARDPSRNRKEVWDEIMRRSDERYSAVI